MAEKKPEKKEEKKDSGGSTSPELNALYWTMAAIIFLSFFLSSYDGKFFSLSSDPVEDPETGRVVGTDDSIKFPTGDIMIGDTIILKADAFARSAPAHSILGKQEKYERATVQEGPIEAFNEQWWRLNFSKAPDGWVPEYAFTKHVSSYTSLHILPITWKIVKPAFWIFGALFLILAIAAKLQLTALRAEAGEKLAPAQPHTSVNHIVVGGEEQKRILTAGDRRSNERWLHIVQLLQSHNQNDWRQAIIEADIILEEMLEKMGYDGMTIGDKLKNVEPSDFRTLNQAWEAHKIRNRIAHMGSEFQISHADTERVINLYQEVFEEFYYI